MESKPKVRQVRKAPSETPERPKSQVQLDSLIRQNGDMIEELFASKPWQEIVIPLIVESIAGVSGRFTNGRFHKGDLTRTSTMSLEKLSGYQLALEDFYNNLQDFVSTRDRMLEEKKRSKEEKSAPLYNPFMEDNDA